MNKYNTLFFAALFLFIGSVAQARDTISRFSIADVINNPENASKLAGVSFYFGNQGHPPVKRSHGEFNTNKKTNAFNKSDLQACQWVMLTALVQLHTRAQSLSANAVIDIKSNYKGNVMSSETEFTCGAGGIMAGVALKGTIVELE